MNARFCEVARLAVSQPATRCVTGRRLPQPTSVMRIIDVTMKRSRIGSPYVDEPALSHGPQLVDVLAPGNGQRHGVGEFFDQEIGR